MATKITAILYFCLLASICISARDLNLTIYNDDLGLIKDQRQVQMPVGKSVTLEITDVAALLDPTSVHLQSRATVREQRFDNNLVNQQKLLRKYLGERIRMKQKDTIIEGTLLSTQGGLVIEQDNHKVLLSPKGEIELPALPKGFVIQPTLSWILDNEVNGLQNIELRYLSRGLRWEADYTLIVNSRETAGDLSSWVTIQNNSGIAYPRASLQLVAGTPHQVSSHKGRPPRTMKLAAMGAAPAFSQESLSEYYVYDLKGKTTLKQSESKQIAFLNASDITLHKKYVLQSSRFSPLGQRQKEHPVVLFQFRNDSKSGLGQPLPKGKIRVYQADTKQRLQFIGEDRINHTPKDETVIVNAGKTFDMVSEKVVEAERRLNNRQTEKTIAITIRNHKKQAVSIDVKEIFWKSMKILSGSHQYHQKDARTVVFPVTVPKDGEITVRYTVLI